MIQIENTTIPPTVTISRVGYSDVGYNWQNALIGGYCGNALNSSNAIYHCPNQEATLTGDQPLVICNGSAVACDDLASAQTKAEELAHKHGCDAFILKPVRKVSPKRDVVSVDLA